MKNIINFYKEDFERKHREEHKMLMVLVSLALVVAVTVSWRLHLTGITLSNETYCGYSEEHTHSEECYETVRVCALEECEEGSEAVYEIVERQICTLAESEGHTHDGECYDADGNLICTLEESEGHTHTEDCYESEMVLVSEEIEAHIHDESCYETVLVCEKEEHTHTEDCLVDINADVETSSEWKETLPDELSGIWTEDVVAVAISQLGYTESLKNYILDEDGITHRGYTRYGDWYGNEYGDWDAMFVSFCLYYAEVSEEYFAEASGSYAWTVELKELGLYAEADEYVPSAGDIVFFDVDGDGKADHVGVVEVVDGVEYVTVSVGEEESSDASEATSSSNSAETDASSSDAGEAAKTDVSSSGDADVSEAVNTDASSGDANEAANGGVSSSGDADVSAVANTDASEATSAGDGANTDASGSDTSEDTNETVSGSSDVEANEAVSSDANGSNVNTNDDADDGVSGDSETVEIWKSVASGTVVSSTGSQRVVTDNITLTVIEGDCDDAVVENTYAWADVTIIGYGVLPTGEDAISSAIAQAFGSTDSDANANTDIEDTDEATSDADAKSAIESTDDADVAENAAYESGVVSGTQDFVYEDEKLTLTVHVTGSIAIENQGSTITSVSGDEEENNASTATLTDGDSVKTDSAAIDSSESGPVLNSSAANASTESDSLTVAATESEAATATAGSTDRDATTTASTENGSSTTASAESEAATASSAESNATTTASADSEATTATLTDSDALTATSTSAISASEVWSSITMTATVLDTTGEIYTTLLEYVEENSDEKLVDMIAMALSFSYEGQVLDMSDCEIEVTLTPTEDGVAATMADIEDAEEDLGVTLTVFSVSDGETAGNDQSEYSYTMDTQDSVLLTSEDTELPVLTATLTASNVLVLTASETANPTFTVQYYAYLESIESTGEVTLTAIDTSGGVLPKNNTTNNTTTVGLNLVSGTAGEVGAVYELNTATTLTQLYTSKTYEYAHAPGLNYINGLSNNTYYELYAMWITTNSGILSETSSTGWTVYSASELANLSFTNNSAAVDETTILITESTVIRLVYQPTSGTFSGLANFYDYDISDGNWYSLGSTSSTKRSTQTNTENLYMYTAAQGINSATNFSGSGTMLAFGNVNTHTGLGSNTWTNNGAANRLNMYNGYSTFGCTFGLVTGLVNGSIQYADGVIAANLFDEGTATGKTTYNSQTVQFVRNGDTYVFSSVSGDANQSDLEYLSITYSSGGTVLYSNNFFPMDTVSSYGSLTHDFKFGSAALSAMRYAFGTTETLKSSSGSSSALPICDDNADHNSYFGMQYAISFTLTEDYCGPLDYFFFGDDDMWVFLDGVLVCDIGGVHSSVGEHVDLWDYLTQGEAGTHTLSFYFTERGASGSTCYMRFTLPGVTSVTPVQGTGTLQVEKEVLGYSSTDGLDFTFVLTLKDSSGNELKDIYGYSSTYNASGNQKSTGTLYSGNTFILDDGDYIVISNLPAGTVCTVTETTTGYTTTVSVDSNTETKSNSAVGTISSGNITVMHFTNVKAAILPKAGSIGTTGFTLIGALMMCGAVCLLVKRASRRKMKFYE